MLVSTRGNDSISSTKAILKGISDNGGLFIFDNIKQIGFNESFLAYSYQEMAKKIISSLFEEFNETDIDYCISNSYNKLNFPNGCITLKNFDRYSYLNLFNGPTFAFKDMALTILPYFVEVSKKIENDNNKTVVLTATSGDTGSAALNGFTKLDNTNVFVLYPNKKVSQFQEKQMLSFNSEKATSFAINGNFDDCQRLVKEFFNKEKFTGIDLSSANSINIGRLVPQIIYYFQSYVDLVNSKKIKFNDNINFCVPTGNFGNILAGYIASLMGLPIKKLICASNKNNVLTDFFKTGTYNAKRDFYTTNSPSMDILVSSNLERLLYLITKDASYVSSLMNDLNTKKEYKIDEKYLAQLDCFYSAFVCEDETNSLIKKEYEENNYLIDPHTAVAYGAYDKYVLETNDSTHTVILSTASPYKFSDTICKALDITTSDDEFKNILKISEVTNTLIDERILKLNELSLDRKVWSLEDSYLNLKNVIGELND